LLIFRGKKKIVFLANKVHLINQQGKYIQSQFGNTSDDGANTVTIITGDLNTDFWEKDRWTEVLDKSHVSHLFNPILSVLMISHATKCLIPCNLQHLQIIVITSEIFKQILRTAYIALEEVALIIFDECHNAVGKDPMSMVR